MTTDLQSLINGYLDDSLTEQEFSRLNDLLGTDTENADAFARAVLLHDRLQSEVSAAAQTAQNSSAPSTKTTTGSTPEATPSSEIEFGPRHRLRGPVLAILIATAACFLAILALAYQNRANQRPQVAEISESASTDFVTVAQSVNVDWSAFSALIPGTRLGSDRITFTAGILRLQFDDGVEVTLEGPADYQLIASGRTRLHRGLLSATVPPGAEGFQVDVSGARITDLGTAFGIRLDDDGAAEVSVFDGKVDVASLESGQKQLLKEGEAVRVAEKAEWVPIDFDSRPYEKVWPVSSGIVGSSGAFRYAPPWPRRLRLIRSNENIFVLPEGYRTTLSEPLDVNISRPGRYRRVEELTPATLPESLPFRTFLLHFRPEESGRGTRVQGSITFDRPVIGLIVRRDELAASKELLSLRGVKEFREERQLELTGTPGGDVITLSDDRHTVQLDLAVPRRFSDLVRVILDDTPIASLSKNSSPLEDKR